MKQTILANYESPRLKGTTMKDIKTYRRTRELYEKQIAEKNGQPGVNFTAGTYRASIDERFLRMFVMFGWVEATDIMNITEEELNKCIKTRANRKPKDHELGRVENIVARVKMDTKMALLQDRVCQRSWPMPHLDS